MVQWGIKAPLSQQMSDIFLVEFCVLLMTICNSLCTFSCCIHRQAQASCFLSHELGVDSKAILASLTFQSWGNRHVIDFWITELLRGLKRFHCQLRENRHESDPDDAELCARLISPPSSILRGWESGANWIMTRLYLVQVRHVIRWARSESWQDCTCCRSEIFSCKEFDLSRFVSFHPLMTKMWCRSATSSGERLRPVCIPPLFWGRWGCLTWEVWLLHCHVSCDLDWSIHRGEHGYLLHLYMSFHVYYMYLYICICMCCMYTVVVNVLEFSQCECPWFQVW